MKLSNEAKVGGLIFITLILGSVFAWIIGIKNPFVQSTRFYVTYHFAGGIEVGSPVRVSGIKVGKVEKIEFFSPPEPLSEKAGSSKELRPGPQNGIEMQSLSIKEPGSEDDQGKMVAPLKVTISVQNEALRGVRRDSRFYINLAGIIGERYIEITPGRIQSPQAQAGDVFAGVDPPRIDQLISQSFDLAGKIKEIVDENKGDLTRSIELMYKLSGNLNKTLGWIDKSAVFKTNLSHLVENLIAITSDVRKITDNVQSAEGEKTLKLLHQLLWRLEPLDSEAIRKFFQKEGVKVQFF